VQKRVPPVWTDAGPKEYWMQREELAAQDARCNAYAAYVAAREEEEDEDEHEPVYGWHHHQRRTKNREQLDDEDPLQTLGRIVKVAGKTLWKQVSNRDVAAAAAAAAAAIPKPRVDSKGQEDSKTGSPTSTEGRPSLTLPPILGSITSNVDDHLAEEESFVWEEIGNSFFPLDISQTETIIEGRAVYSRSTNKVDSEVVSRSPPPSPSVSNSKKVLTKPHTSKKVPLPFKVKQGS